MLAKKVSRRGVFIFAGVLLLAAGVIAQVYFNIYMLSRVNAHEPAAIKALLIDSLTNITNEVVVDGPTGKVYMPEARLVLPVYPKDVSSLLYSYSPAQPDVSGVQLSITSKGAMRFGVSRINNGLTIDDVFAAVPTAQACTRQLIITFAANSDLSYQDEYNEIYTKPLTDGRTAYVHAAKACQEGSNELAAYLRDIQSY